MGIRFDINNSKAANDYAGRMLYDIKQLLVSTGLWQVVASGDGSGRFAWDVTEQRTATAGAATSLTDGAASFVANAWNGGTITIVAGTGAGQTRTISTNTATVFNVTAAWTVNPNATSVYTLSKTATTPGSGGAYDVWTSGNTRTNSTPVTNGDAGNQKAWCILQSTGGTRQIILQNTAGSGVGGAGWSSYANIAYNPGITNRFIGMVASAATTGGAAADEYFLYGARDGNGAEIANFVTAGYYHIWASDVAASDGMGSWGYYFVRTSDETMQQYFMFGGIDTGSVFTADQDPVIVMWNTNAPSATNAPFANAWSTPLATNVTITNPLGLNNPYLGNGSVFDGKEAATQYLPGDTTGGSGYPRGMLEASIMLNNCVGSRPWGDVGTDQYGRDFVTWGNGGGMMTPWPDNTTKPLPHAAALSTFTIHVVDKPITLYVQRVWSSGLSAWCYYTQTAINASPASTDTTPNWTGAISGHEVLGTYT